MVNCPCSVHTEERGYEWVVFRRQPDRKICSTDEDDDEDNSTSESISDDDVFFSAEAEDALLNQRTDYTETTPDCTGNLEKEDSSTDVSDGKEKARPQMSSQPRESSLHSRENRGETSTTNHQSHQKKKKIKTKREKEKEKIKTIGTSESPMIIDDDGQTKEREIPKKRKGFSYYPLLTYKRNLDKTITNISDPIPMTIED